MLLYEQLADEVSGSIASGVYPLGSRLPSVRHLSRRRGVSISTCVRAYHELERRGVILAAPKSGFFVNGHRHSALPSVPCRARSPVPVTGGNRILRLLDAASDSNIVNFGAATPHPDFMPAAEISAASRKVWHRARRRCMTQAFPPGTIELRSAVAQRLATAGCCLCPEDILITNGCQEAISIALSILCEPGDVVAVEAPTYYGLLELLEQQGLRALPIPSDPSDGISLTALEKAFRTGTVRTCVITPVASNPMGVTLTYDVKKALIELIEAYQIPLIEDDTYGELIEAGHRHTPLKSWDRSGLIYYCGSATKTICAGLRIGWLAAPEHERAASSFEQYVRTISVNTHAQLTLAEYFATGHIDRAMRLAARSYRGCNVEMITQLEKHFPSGTLISAPQGGFLIWVELDKRIDTSVLLDESLKLGVSFAPGTLFAPNQGFTNCLRLNSAVEWNHRSVEAFTKLSDIVRWCIK